MNVDWTSVFDVLAAALGITTGAAGLALACLYVARGALIKAVELAGQKEIEARKSELAKEVETFKSVLAADLEKLKATAQRELAFDLERERAAAMREMERFKIDLTMASEVRRQTAAMKVKALLEFLRAAQQFQREAFDSNENGVRVARLKKCFGQVEEVEPLVDHAKYVQMSNLVSHIFTAADHWERGRDDSAISRTADELKTVIAMVREELARL